MDFNRLTIKSQEAAAGAQELARRNGNPEVYSEHLTLALLDQELPRTLLERAGQSVPELRAQAEATLASKPAVQGASAQQPRVSTAFSRVLEDAEKEMRRLEDEYLSTEHLLLALDLAPRDAVEDAPRADRRPGRWQDRHRRGARAAHRRGGRPRGPEGQARLGTRHRLAPRGLEVPR